MPKVRTEGRGYVGRGVEGRLAALLGTSRIHPATILAVALQLWSCGGDDESGDDGGNGGGAGASGGSSASGGRGGSSGSATGGATSGGTTSGGTSGNAGSSSGTSSGGSSGRGGGGGNAQGGSGGSGTAGAGTGGGGGGTVMGPRFIGRFTNDGRFAWSGATIALRFTGTAVSVTLDDGGENFVNATIDDGEPLVIDLEAGMRTYEVATGLSNGPHEVRVTRRTEAFFNPTRFVSFSVPESSWLPSSAPDRRIEVIGDSISAGYGIEGVGPNCGFSADTENHALTYEAVAARELGADLHTEAWSGIGIYRNNDGSMTNLMPSRFPLVIPTESATTWDFSRFQPHAVVVYLGTNDFAMGDPGSGFATAHENFAADLREHYPNARIYLAVGPMMDSGATATALGYLEDVVEARNADGDDAISVIELGLAMASEGLGCDYHPNEVTNARMANTLVARLRADLGW